MDTQIAEIAAQIYRFSTLVRDMQILLPSLKTCI